MNSEDIIAQAIADVFDEQTDEFLSSLDLNEQHSFSRRHIRKMRRLITRQRKPYFKLVCTAARRAACIVIVLTVFSASAMSVKAVRKKVFDLISSVFAGGIVITAESSQDCPDIIEEEYVIADLSPGYELRARDKTETSLVTAYHSKSHDIKLAQFAKPSYKGIYNSADLIGLVTDPEGREYHTFSVNGRTVYIWDDGSYIFEFTSDLDRKTALDLCRSVKPQDK